MLPLLINTYDRGGAAIACLRLQQGLKKIGLDAKVLVKNKTKFDIDDIQKISLSALQLTSGKKIARKLKSILKELHLFSDKPDKFLAQRRETLEMFSYPFSGYDLRKSELYKAADIINLHWVADFLDYRTFFSDNDKPVIWTLHDQNPFSGGEHYHEVYDGIDNAGFPVKRKINEIEKEKFEYILDVKKKALKDFDNLQIIALCNWMKSQVEDDSIFADYPVTVIPNGIDSRVFQPRDRVYSRELLDIPIDKKIILFVSDNISNFRKGFVFIQRIIEKSKFENTVFLAVGDGDKSIEGIRYLGSVYDELLMSIIYSAADVFVIPSLMDNLPNTVLESLMCGTPVIGFPVGGIPDMIQDGVNGYLTEEISVPALKQTIEKFLGDPDFFNRDDIRKRAIEKYDLSVQAKAYTELFHSILNKH